MNIQIIKGDITAVATDVIVNAANTSLLGGGGVDGAIHRKGGPAILEECVAIRAKQGGCKTGEAVITTAGKLQAKFVIHTVGPVWNADKTEKESLLKNCYTNSLKLATNHSLRSIAFPNISTGIYHFPKDKAVKIAFEAVHDFFMEHKTSAIKEVMFVCFDDENYALYNEFPAVFTTLYRPLYQPELSLIEQSNWLSFPPRLPEQPIFYPVTNEQYAIQIATEWNVPAYGVGHVVEFDLSNQFLSKYKVENVGGDIHNEYWIPSEELAEMNNNILGTIRLTKTFQK